MTAQEIFDKCKEHLLKQNFKCSLTNPGSGIYKRHDGAACPIGAVIISDDEYDRETSPYDPTIELKSIVDVWKHGGIKLKQETRDLIFANIKLLKDIQDLHDKIPVSSWNDELRVIADKHGLKND